MEFIQILELFKFILDTSNKIIQFIKKRTNWCGFPDDIQNIAFAFHNHSFSYLQQKAQTISEIGYIHRQEIGQIQQLWKRSEEFFPPILLHGEAGSGKSEIVLSIGKKTSDNGTPVLFINAKLFSSSPDPLSDITNLLPIDCSLINAISKISKHRTCLVIIDQLDSIFGNESYSNFVNLIRSLSNFPNTKLIVVTSNYVLHNDENVSSLNFVKIESNQLSNESVNSYLTQLGINNPSEEIIHLSKNLLNLSLIAFLVKELIKIPDNILNEAYLWIKYLSVISAREGEEFSEYIQNLAVEATSQGENTFPINFPNQNFRKKLLNRNILVEVQGRRYAFRHEQLQYFLCAYSLLPLQYNIQQVINKFTGIALTNVISWLHRLYHIEFPDLEASFIYDVLSDKFAIPFYSRTPVLDNLQQQPDPTSAAANVILNYRKGTSYQQYFFKTLKTPLWISPLHNIGFFSNPPDIIEVEPGSFKFPDWPAGKYLARFAQQYEDTVIEVVNSIKTENWRVQEIFIEAMTSISPEKSAKILPVIDQWLDGRFSDMLPFKLIPLADFFIENGYPDQAIQILDYVITPKLRPDAKNISEYRSPICFRSLDPYWVYEFLSKIFNKVNKTDPINVVSAFESQIIHSIDLLKQIFPPEEVEEKMGFYWRMDIQKQSYITDTAGATDILIDGLIESLTECCEQSFEESSKFLESYLINEHMILKRAALFLLRKYGQIFPDLVNQAFLNTNQLEKTEYRNEYLGLMREQFSTANNEVREQVINAILSGPTDIENRVNNLAKRENRQISGEDFQKVKNYWELYHLEILRSWLIGHALSRLNELTELYGKPDTTEKPYITSSSFEFEKSPISVEDITNQSFDTLKSNFLTYAPGESYFYSRESLARTFGTAVSQNSSHFVEFASYLIDYSMRYIYIYYYLSGIIQGIKNTGCKLTDELIDLCIFIANQKEDVFIETSGDYEPRLEESQLEVARLLEEALRSQDPYLSRKQLDHIRAILFTLSNHPNPTKEDENRTDFEPFLFSMNCVRGSAMHGIIMYSLYIKQQNNIQSGQQNNSNLLEDEVTEILEIKLDLSIEPSLAIHSIFGAYIVNLYYLSNEWLKINLPSIFPPSEDKYLYWKAAWDAYLFASIFDPTIFNLLNSQYEKGLRLLSQIKEEQKYFSGSPDERLAQHIMRAYLDELTDFYHENKLLDLFFENASDEIRAKGIFWISKVLGNEKPSKEDALWNKCWLLWHKRLEFAETKEPSQNTKEISNYTRWLDHCPVSLDETYPILYKSVKYSENNYHTQQIAKYAAQFSEKYPKEAVDLLKSIVFSSKEPLYAAIEENEEKIIKIALENNSECRQHAIEIINYLGEQGDFHLKYLLD